jgi:hypothetical protein
VIGLRPAARQASSTLADLQQQVSALTRELTEAREQQKATSEVLHVISSSSGDLAPVFKAMLENATRLCEAESASLVLREGGDIRFVARYNAPAALLEQTLRDPIFRPGPDSGLAARSSMRYCDQSFAAFWPSPTRRLNNHVHCCTALCPLLALGGCAGMSAIRESLGC